MYMAFPKCLDQVDLQGRIQHERGLSVAVRWDSWVFANLESGNEGGSSITPSSLNLSSCPFVSFCRSFNWL